MCKLIFINALIAGLAMTSVAFAGPGVWSGNGPEGGNVRSLAVSADQPARIYLASLGGIFRSDDEGQGWTNISAGLPSTTTSALAAAPGDADRVYAAVGKRIFRSDDAGASWSMLSGWSADWGIVYHLHVQPDDANTLFASGRYGGLKLSTDGGGTWSRIDDETRFQQVFGFTVLAGSTDTLLMVAWEHGEADLGVFRSIDGGATWSEVAVSQISSAVRFFSNDAGRVLALPASAMSEDGGASWTQFSLPEGIQLATQVAVFDPHDEDAWYLGGQNGLIYTDDAGANYSVVSDGMGPAGAGGYNGGVTALALKPGTSDVLLTGSEHTGFYRSTNGGVDWQRRNSGFFGVTIRSLAVNPTNSNIIYAGQRDATTSMAENLWASFDGGNSWSVNNGGLTAGGVRGLALDPNTAGNPPTSVLYAAGWSVLLEDVSMPNRPTSGGIYKSSSGAFSWDDVGGDLPPGGFDYFEFSLLRTVALDPSSGSGVNGDGPLQTVYVGGNGRIDYSDDGSGNTVPDVIRARIYRSDDAGQNWQSADSGMPVPEFIDGLGARSHTVIQLHVNPLEPDTLYAATILGNTGPFQDAGEVPTEGNGIFRSIDGGQNWSLASSGLPRFDDADPTTSHWDVLAMDIAASAPDTLYAAASPINDFQPSIVFRSNDGGGSWIETNNGIPDDIDIRWIEVDPTDPDVVYVAGGGTVDNPGSVFRTEDGGENWVSYSIGLPASSATALAIDRSGANPIVHAGSRGGVFSIEQVPDEDIDGVPDGTEVSAPNGGDGNADGIPDRLQEEVASLQVPDTNLGGLRGLSDYISVELVEKGGSECSRLMNVHALPENVFPIDENFSFPYGILRFEIPDCPGAVVRITFQDMNSSGFDGDWQFRAYTPDEPGNVSTIRWQPMPDSTHDGHAWLIQINDGQLGDLRPTNGRILFQGGAAVIEENEIFADRFEG